MYSEKTLPNGIRVVYQKLEGFQSICTGIWIGTGSIDENENEAGISHLIEHMLFKGTPKRNAQQIAQEMDGIGGILNAFTSKECTCYHARVTDEHIETAMDLLCDITFHSLLDAEELKKEQGVILEEINMAEDTPEDVVHELLSKAYYHSHALSKPILGTAESVSGFTPDGLRAYLNRRYAPENIVIAAAGGLEFEKLCDLAEQYTEGIESNYIEKQDKLFEPQPRCFTAKEKPIEQAHFCLASPGYKMTDEELYSMSVLNNAFGGSMSSRLFQNIREQRGLAYDVYSHPTSYSFTGSMTIYAGVNPQRSVEALEVVLEEIDKIAKEGISDEEFSRAKEQLKGNYALGLESTNARMNAIGRSKTLTGKMKTAEETMDGIQRVTPDSVRAILPHIFDLEHTSASAAGNIDIAGFEKVLGVKQTEV